MIDDIDNIMTVMTAAFDPTYGEAWSRRQVEDAILLGSCHYRIVNKDGQPPKEGETASGFFLSRCGYEEEELLLIAVSPDARTRGLGRILLDHLKVDAQSRGAQRLLLEMRRCNPARSLYENFGFYSIGERPEYYRTPDGKRLDAITFACNVS